MFEPVVVAEHEEYLAGLNRSFGDWGTHDRLAWVLRPFGGMEPDIFGRRDDGRLAAGSIVSYRQVARGDEVRWIGIMTGSWTDPELRGRGLFTEVIAHSAEAVRLRGGAALAAFVTAGNASRGRLERAGSTMIPTWYLSTPTTGGPAARGRWRPAADPQAALAELEATRIGAAGDAGRFAYPQAADLSWQWLARSSATRVLESAAGDIAVVEDAGETTRLLAGGPNGVDADFGSGQVFSFSCDPAVADLARDRGATVVDGFLTVLPVDEAWDAPVRWQVDNGDRI